MRGIARRLRTTFSIGSSRMAIRSQLAWYWRWLLNVLMMVGVAVVVWWIVQNSYGITGFTPSQAREQIGELGDENRALKQRVDALRASLVDRDRQRQIDQAAQAELARSVAKLQDENAALKEDLGFLRKIMSSGTTPEGIGVTDLTVEHDGSPNEFHYRMLLTQGGQRKQDFKGRVQLVAKVLRDGAMQNLTFPDPDSPEAASFEFRFYRKVEGRFAVLPGDVVKSVDVRILAVPGGQVKLSRTVNLS